jgi:hypothetical protein
MEITKLGYRNNSWGGSGVFSLEEVLFFEQEELENEDIPLTLGVTAEEVVPYLERKTNVSVKKLFALWLTSKEGVLRYYEGANGYTGYHLPKDAFSISDLDEQGILWVSSIHPREWEQEWISEEED